MALINYITQIQFEFGAIGLLAQQCERIGIRRPLIVTDRGVKAAGIIDTVLNALAHAGTVAIYDRHSAEPEQVGPSVRAMTRIRWWCSTTPNWTSR